MRCKLFNISMRCLDMFIILMNEQMSEGMLVWEMNEFEIEKWPSWLANANCVICAIY